MPCRRNWFVVEFNCPPCIAFLTASVNDENDATVWIGLFNFFDVISRSVDDFVVGQNNADDDDDEVFGWSDKCFRLAKGDQRFWISVDELGAKRIILINIFIDQKIIYCHNCLKTLNLLFDLDWLNEHWKMIEK